MPPKRTRKPEALDTGKLRSSLDDPRVGIDVGVTLSLVRQLIGEMHRRDLRPAVKGALLLLQDCAEIASVLALPGELEPKQKVEYGRAIVEARMLLGGHVAFKKGGAVLSTERLWRRSLSILVSVAPQLDSVQEEQRTTLARLTSLWLEVHVGRRPSTERTLKALEVVRRRSGRPKKGTESRTKVLRNLFAEMGLPTGASNANLSSEISRLLKTEY